MVCKKCGFNVSDNAKFCGYCGNPIEEPNKEVILSTEPQTIIQDNNVNEISVDSGNDILFNSEKTEVNSNIDILAPIEQPKIEEVNQTLNNVSNQNKKSGKNSKIPFIILGVVLMVLGLSLIFGSISKNYTDSINVLNKAISNLNEKGAESGTINVKLLTESSTSDSFNLSATAKYSKNNDVYDFEFTLNKSLINDEVSFYSRIDKDKIYLYAKSSIIDMLGLTNSDQDVWLHYFTDFVGMVEEENTDDLDISEILDKNNFKYVNKVDNLNHYQLIINKSLIENIKSKLSDEELVEIEETLDVIIEELNQPYIIDFYINNSNEIVRISVDLTSIIDVPQVSNANISIEFADFNKTTVVIPSDALESKIDLETYMSTNSSFGNFDDISSEFEAQIPENGFNVEL